MRQMSRRRFLKYVGTTALAVFTTRGGVSALAAGRNPERDQTFVPDVEISLTARPGQVSILPGAPTDVWVYEARVISGPSDAVQPLANTYLGPTMRWRKGQRIRVHFTNRIPEETIVHWHGLHVPELADGHPRFVIGEGETYVYEFEVMDRAGTYWYHPHPHGRTGPQAYRGLAGLIYLSDDTEAARGLPSGRYDMPLVLQDRQFDTANQLVYSTPMAGFLGDTILVNGQPDAAFDVEATSYRLRLLNGSNSRIYKLAWSDDTPLTVIGTDGGLLDTPVTRSYVTLAPGERVELLVDFSQWSVGSRVRLESRSFAPGGGVGGGMGSGVSSLPNGAPFTVATFTVVEPASTPTPTPTPTQTPTPVPTPTPTAPSAMAYVPFLSYRGVTPTTSPAVGAPRVAATRTFYLYMIQGRWVINGRVFEMTAVAPDEVVELGSKEIWEFANMSPTTGGGPGGPGGPGGGGMMGMPHPMHIHGLQFRVVSRIPPTNSTQRANWETLKDGYVDEGWKDTVLVMPGERVQVEVEFKDYTGLYLYHCHNLEHEDMGMMRNYRVVSP